MGLVLRSAGGVESPNLTEGEEDILTNRRNTSGWARAGGPGRRGAAYLPPGRQPALTMRLPFHLVPLPKQIRPPPSHSLSSAAAFPLHALSLSDPATFWSARSSLIHWHTPPTTPLDSANHPHCAWYGGGTTNLCFNAVDRHLPARASQPALVFDSAVTGEQSTHSYAQLHASVLALASILHTRCAVRPGDRVLIYMPTLPEAVAAMLACARLGAVHSVVFGGFAAPELRARLADSAPVVVLAASYGREGRHRVVPYAPPLVEALAALAAGGGALPRHVLLLSRGVRASRGGEGEGGDAAAAAAEAAAEEAAVDAPRALQAALAARGHSGVGAPEWLSWGKEVAAAAAAVAAAAAAAVPPPPPVWLPSGAPSYIIYTSGSTGTPKGVVRDTGGHAVALTAAMTGVYGMQPGEVWWAASDIGWVVGHSFAVYGPLLAGCTSVIFEGKPVGTPDAETFWRVASRHRVAGMFTAPTALRAIKREDAEGRGAARYDLSSLRTLFVAGERCDPDTHAWASRSLKKPVVDHWWATEFGSPVLSTPLQASGAPAVNIAVGAAGLPVPGYDVRVLHPRAAAGAGAAFFETAAATEEKVSTAPLFTPSFSWAEVGKGVVLPPGLEVRMDLGSGTATARRPPPTPPHHAALSPHPWLPEAACGQLGPIVVRLPLPPGALTGLYRAEARFRASYTDAYPGYFDTGDAGFVDAGGAVHVMCRADDVINVAGHRLSAGAMEAAVAAHPDVAEAAVIGVTDSLKGSVPVALIVLRSGATAVGAGDAAAARVRASVGPLAALRAAVVVQRLPKTRSGKVLRATLRAIANGVAYKVPATIEEEGALGEVAEALKGVGLGGSAGGEF